MEQMMKKFFALLLCACMLFAFAAPAVKATEEIQVCDLIFDEIDEVYGPDYKG